MLPLRARIKSPCSENKHIFLCNHMLELTPQQACPVPGRPNEAELGRYLNTPGLYSLCVAFQQRATSEFS